MCGIVATIGYKRDDVRMKISQNLTGRKLSQETKEKISNTLKLKRCQ